MIIILSRYCYIQFTLSPEVSIFIIASIFLSKDAILTFIHVTQFRILLFTNGYFLRSAVFILLCLLFTCSGILSYYQIASLGTLEE
uniref:Ovule protein n=1 Tax=Strongyloides venezuelensis TaxID=75913 RepID=A0A0K0EYP0_STRVS